MVVELFAAPDQAASAGARYCRRRQGGGQVTDNVSEMNAARAGQTGGGGRKGFYDRIAAQSIAPLWEVLPGIAPREPAPTLAAHAWRWEECRSYLMEAGDLLTAEQAERRALLLENPAIPGRSRTTGTLTGAIQL